MKSIAFFLTIFLISCTDKLPFDYSPFSINLEESQKNLNQKAKDALETIVVTDPDNYQFAIISDSHGYPDAFYQMLATINKDSNIVFVIHLGNIVPDGVKFQYTSLSSLIAESLTQPFFVNLGDTDSHNNGKLIYQAMFGNELFTFTYGNSKFIFFDTNLVESHQHNQNIKDDLDWLDDELGKSKSYNSIFVATYQSIRQKVPKTHSDKIHSLLNQHAANAIFSGAEADQMQEEVDHIQYISTGFQDGTQEKLLPYFLVVTVRGAIFEIEKHRID